MFYDHLLSIGPQHTKQRTNSQNKRKFLNFSCVCVNKISEIQHDTSNEFCFLFRLCDESKQNECVFLFVCVKNNIVRVFLFCLMWKRKEDFCLCTCVCFSLFFLARLACHLTMTGDAREPPPPPSPKWQPAGRDWGSYFLTSAARAPVLPFS